MLLADVVATSAAVGATRSRTAKIAALAGLLRRAPVAEIESATAWLSGEPRQERLGVGWRTLVSLDAPPAAEPGLSVAAVEEQLAALALTSGEGSVARRSALLTALFCAATAAEQDFLRRLITGELRHGALDGVVLAAIAEAGRVSQATVRRAFMLGGRLPGTARLALTEGADGLAAVTLRVGTPVRPMLASPAATLDAALADLGPGDSVVEFKLDGARIQVHRDGDDVRAWTRSLREITPAVPELVELVRGLPCRTVVLDGESLTLTDDGRPRPFQETMSRFGSEGPLAGPSISTEGSLAGPSIGTEGSLAGPSIGTDGGERILRPFFFDCLHLDGTDLIDEPLSVRLDALERVAAGHRIPGALRPTAEEAADVLDRALAAGHEGVVVKSLAAPYAAGRRGRSWQKVKPVHTLDLVVLGAEWGYGRRTGSLSNIHLGARDPDGGAPIMVGKTFKGMTDELLAWQTATFPGLVREDHGHQVLLRPELVVEIAVDGAQRSTRYPGGVALRFARVVRYRPDKSPADADPIDAVRALLPRSES